jgi:hypothetical protein
VHMFGKQQPRRKDAFAKSAAWRTSPPKLLAVESFEVTSKHQSAITQHHAPLLIQLSRRLVADAIRNRSISTLARLFALSNQILRADRTDSP